MDLTPKNVFSLLQSTNDFPVDFDDAWQWIGYTRKDNAKAALLNAGFVEGIDFQVSLNIQENSKGGRPSERISLTVECFKSFAMMAGTFRGKEVRFYFIECERRLKELYKRWQSNHRERVIKAAVQQTPSSWVKRFEDEFFDEAYRITGWKRPERGHLPCMGGFINTHIYDHFPDGVPERIRELNPKNEKGNRPRKYFQHLTDEVGLPVLSAQKAATIAVMRLSPSGNTKKFKENMMKACGSQVQIDLPFMDEFD